MQNLLAILVGAVFVSTLVLVLPLVAFIFTPEFVTIVLWLVGMGAACWAIGTVILEEFN